MTKNKHYDPRTDGPTHQAIRIAATGQNPYACAHCGRGPLEPDTGDLCPACAPPACAICDRPATHMIPSTETHLCRTCARAYALALKGMPVEHIPSARILMPIREQEPEICTCGPNPLSPAPCALHDRDEEIPY